MFAEYFGNYWTVILAGAIVAVSCVLMAMSFVVLTVKNKLVSMLISENPILIYIKENGLLDDTIDIVKNVLKNDAIKQYISSAKLVFDQEKFVSCWNVIKDDLSQMTVAQLEDMDYIFSLVKKSKILPVILEHVTIRNLKKLFNLAKTIPLGEIIKEISAISAPQQQLQLDAIGANA